ncbi:MAG: glycosyltransferase, partial [Gammaproteobacteria bacterium]|nr:glycosyltransferase [Gammaproteobacteria bacterium]
PCKAIFLEKGLGNWYDVNGLDVLIVMRDDYDLSRLTNRSPRLITIGWARNWIDRWPKRPWAQDYQGYWASSMKAANYLAKSLARPVEVVPIATSRASFTDGVSRGELKSDYCFTGNYWGAPRDIADLLKPETIPFQFALFGYGWENHPTFAKFARGGLPYSRMKDVYASTRVVIDDANSATKQWGSVNSRVFDALAAGALVITNGEEGAGEIFGGLLPTYRSAEELTAVLTHYLTDEAGRVTLVEQLRRVVSNANTYGHRANVVRQNLLRLSENQLRFAIKIGAPNQSVLDEWGGYHFAVGIQRSLARLGHSARIDCLDQWNRADAVGDDIVIVLRGLSKYEPQVHQINVMWNISHPDKVSDDEYESYDHVFVASKRHARSLASRLSTPVSALLQCTDPEIFNPDVPPQERHEVLFVGNSCKVLHRIVRDALSAGLPLSVFGRRWEGIIPPNHIKGTRIPNQQLAGYYVSAGAVLNDHWDSMQQHGFISNRLFDAAACGARIVSDRIEGLDEVFGTLVLQYDEPAALKLAIERLMSEISPDRDKRLSLARHVIEHHNFDVRAQSILAVVYDHDRRKTSLFPGG